MVSVSHYRGYKVASYEKENHIFNIYISILLNYQ